MHWDLPVGNSQMLDQKGRELDKEPDKELGTDPGTEEGTEPDTHLGIPGYTHSRFEVVVVLVVETHQMEGCIWLQVQVLEGLGGLSQARKGGDN